MIMDFSISISVTRIMFGELRIRGNLVASGKWYRRVDIFSFEVEGAGVECRDFLVNFESRVVNLVF